MIELLRSASQALIANDAVLLERIVDEVSYCAERWRVAASADPGLDLPELRAEIGAAAEVLRQQVSAASTQFATRRRLSTTSSMQAHPWVR